MNVIQYLNTIPEAIIKISRSYYSYTIDVKHSDIKDDCMVKGYYGRGDSLVKAINDLSEQIRNQTIIIEYLTEDYTEEGRDRKTYQVPDLKRIFSLEDVFEDLIEDMNKVKWENINKKVLINKWSK